MNIMTKMKALMGDITSQHAEIGAKIGKLQERRAFLQTAPVNKADYLEYLFPASTSRGQATLSGLLSKSSRRDFFHL